MMHIDVCKKLVAAKGGEKPIVAFVFGPLGVLSMLRNQEDLYMDIYDDPDAVKEAVKEINETLKEYCIALAETGINAIMFDTLFASGSIMSKEMWDDMEGEAIEELRKRQEAAQLPQPVQSSVLTCRRYCKPLAPLAGTVVKVAGAAAASSSSTR